jgi:hypothetical protein
MTMSEYEERFRTPAPSLHQILAATRGPNTTRRRSRRFWVAVSVLGVLTVTMEIASHHTAHSHIGKGSQVCQSSIG